MRAPSLWDTVAARGAPIAGELSGAGGTVALAAVASGSVFPGRLDALRGRSILLATHDQWPTAIALLELDGVARRVVLATPDLSLEQLTAVAAIAACDTVVTDEGSTRNFDGLPPRATFRPWVVPDASAAVARVPSDAATEWILLTSGTTGTPKLVVHSLQSLGGTLPRHVPGSAPVVWSTFYDIRRYGGLQIYLRAVLGGSALVLSGAGEPMDAFLARVAAKGVTHMSGTPSHWRRALMSGAAKLLNPRYVRLSGEVADQPLLDALAAAFPKAVVAHAFASTEAGVAFEVADGRAGFPAAFVGGAGPSGIEMQVVDGTLRIRSGRTAARYLGTAAPALVADGGFVDTGDLVELHGDRYYFRGRRGGVINVGGLKVFPEEVEAIINADPRVRMSQVRGRRNPITGAIVVADVVLVDDTASPLDPAGIEHVKAALLQACRRALPPHKVPAAVRLVPQLDVTAGGKLVRGDA